MSASVPAYRPPKATPVGHARARVEIEERPAWAISGWAGVLVVAACIAAGVLARPQSGSGLIAVPIVVGVVILGSLVIVQPGQTRVVRFFGSYVGTVRRTGLSWILPLADRRNVSIRVRNFETNHLKVNDADGNPVEIAAIVVWQVADTSRALYAVDDYLNFVRVQAESALRHVATTHPYDDPTGAALHCAARPTSSPASSRGDGRAGRDRRGGDRRGAHQPPRLRPGDRPGHAAPPAGQRRRRRPLAHRRGRGRDGRARARPLDGARTSSSSTRSARRRW